MKKNRSIAIMTAAALLFACGPVQAAENVSIAEQFQNPGVESKGMFRYWLPDGAMTYEDLQEEMTEMYESGFGGVEIAFFPGMVNFDNTEYGWATENWRELMKNALKVAASLPDGFIVDFTISPGWPVAFNDIDPNDEAADMELVSAMTKIGSGESTVEMPIAEISKTDSVGTPFIIKNELVAAVTARVAEVDESGGIILDPATLQEVGTALSDKTTAAGIPAVDNLDENSEEYQYVLGLYDGEIPDTSIYFTDSVGNPTDIRTPLDDIQNYWTADLSSLELGDYVPSEGEDIQAGDYVLYGFYQRGTGGTLLNMGLHAPFEETLPGVAYYTSPLSQASTDEITAFLDKNIFCDDELTALMKEASAKVGGAVFEDSLENTYPDGIAWNGECAEFFEKEMGYDALKYLPFITGSAASSDADESKYQTDYNTTLSRMYQECHIKGVQSYINEKTGFSYRTQAYLTRPEFVIDTSAASAQADIAEGESLAFGINYDSFRLISSGVHIADKKLVSDEAFALQTGISYNLKWDMVTKIMNGDFAAGVNRLIFHGASANKSNAGTGDISMAANAWPGWSAFAFICTESWGPRMPYWEDIEILSDYIARNQAVLQNGTPKMDLLVYDLDCYDYSTRELEGDNSAFKSLLDAGYSYDCVMDDGLLLENNTVSDGVVCADGPAYKAVLVNNVTKTSVNVMQKLLEFANEGVPVIFYQSMPERAAGNTDTDERIQELTTALKETGNTATVSSQAEALRVLAQYNIAPSASYAQANLRSIMREDTDGTRYYYLYNNSNDIIDVPVDFQGKGNAYLMNAWDGSIAPAVQYASTENTVHTTLHMEAHDTMVVALSENEAIFPETIENPVISTNGQAVYVDGNATVRTTESGEISVAYADGTEKTEEVTVPEPVKLENWNLSIESFGPDTENSEPDATKRVSIDVGETALMGWDDLTVSAEQLEAAGVESMSEVSGIGYYKTEAELTGAAGAYLVLEHGDDMITDIIVNGQKIEGLQTVSNKYDIGSAVQEGMNTKEVKLATTLINRTKAENSMYESLESAKYGITSATLVPYVEVR